MESSKIERLNTISQMVLTEQEVNKLNALKAMATEEIHTRVPDGDPRTIEQFTDDEYLTRILVARNWTVKKAYDMWDEALKFWLEVKPHKIQPDEMEKPLALGKMYYHGFDKEKRPILVLCARRMVAKDLDPDQEFKFGVYMLEQGRELSKDSVDGKIVVLWDRTGFSRKNFSRKYVGMMKKTLKMMADNYPEMLYRFYVIKPNFIFKTFLVICRPFMTERTRKKFKLITDVKQLKEFITDDNLLIEHGGNSKYIYSFRGNQVIDEYTHNGNIQEDANEEDLREMSKEILQEEGLEEDLKKVMEEKDDNIEKF